MSLILDALKKSEQERLRAPTSVSAPPRPLSKPRRATRWPWILGGGITVVAGLALWFFLGSADEPIQPPGPTVQALSSESMAPAEAPALEALSKPAETAEAVETRAAAEPGNTKVPGPEAVPDVKPELSQPAVAALPSSDGPAGDTPATGATVEEAAIGEAQLPDRGPQIQPTVGEAGQSPAQESPLKEAADQPVSAPIAAEQQTSDGQTFDLRAARRNGSKASTSSQALGGEEPVPPLSSLPFATQKAILPIDLQVHVYDDNPSRRFVMVNGSMLVEGSDVKTGLRIEQILPQGVVFSWQGQRFLFSRAD